MNHIIFILLLASGFLQGQALYKVTSEIRDTTLLNKMDQINPKILSLLSNDNSVLISVRYNDSLIISENLNSELNELSMSGIIAESSDVCINSKSNIIFEQVNLRDDLYLVERPLNLEDWLFTGRTAIINQKEAKEAILIEDRSTLFDKRIFKTVVWYSTGKEKNVGPGKYNGFPGLVVRVETKTSNYDLISFTENHTKDYSCPLGGILITEDDYNNIRLNSSVKMKN